MTMERSKVSNDYALLEDWFNSWFTIRKFAEKFIVHCDRQHFDAFLYCGTIIPKVFSKKSLKSSPCSVNGNCTTILPREMKVLASCRGYLLLDPRLMFRGEEFICICRPTNGAYLLVRKAPITFGSKSFDISIENFGLAVNSMGIKLVVVSKLDGLDGSYFKFKVLQFDHSSSSSSEVNDSQVVLSNQYKWYEVEKTFTSIETAQFADGSLPIFLHDSVHWLQADGKILVFETKREVCKSIPSIPKEKSSKYGYQSWFGVANGMLTLAFNWEYSIVIWGFDYINKIWTMKHEIQNSRIDRGLRSLNDNDLEHSSPMFFDGERLIFLDRVPGEDGNISRYNTKDKKWDKIDVMPAWLDANYVVIPVATNMIKLPSRVTKSFSYAGRGISNLPGLDEFNICLMELKKLLNS